MEDKLVKALGGLKKPALTARKKRDIKLSIMEQIDAPCANYVRSFANNVLPDASIRARIKEYVFTLIENRRQKSFILQNFFALHKKFVSAFVLILMAFGMFSFVNVNMNVVMAETFTVLKFYSGDVSLERGGKAVAVYEGMKILENDKIVTGKDALASVEFFDNSISRLAENTEIVIKKLFKPKGNSVKSIVEISLLNGNLWSRVLNLVEEQSSFVVGAMNVFAAAKRAAFNVNVSDKTVQINVFKNSIDIKITDNVKRVVSGQKALLSGKKVEIKKMADSDKNNEWVTENLSNDRLHLITVEERLLKAKMDSVGIKLETKFNANSSVREDLALFLTFGDVNKKKMELDLAEKNFIAAEVKLNDPKITPEEKEEVLKAIENFSIEVNAYYNFVNNVGHTDAAYASELKKYAHDKIMMQKKNLSLVLSNDPSYEAKKVVENLELLGAEDKTEFVKIKSDQIISKVFDAEEAVELGETDNAQKALKESENDIGVVVDALNEIDEKDPELKKELTEKVAGTVEIFDNIQVVSEEQAAEMIVEPSEISETAAADAPAENTENVVIVEPEPETPAETYGITVEGDKPLPPLLNVE